MDQQTVNLLLSLLGALEVLLKSGDNLFKRLFINCSSSPCCIKVQLVYALSKKARKPPSADSVSEYLNGFYAFVVRQMDEVLCVRIIFARLLICLSILLLLQLQKVGVSLPFHCRASRGS